MLEASTFQIKFEIQNSNQLNLYSSIWQHYKFSKPLRSLQITSVQCLNSMLLLVFSLSAAVRAVLTEDPLLQWHFQERCPQLRCGESWVCLAARKERPSSEGVGVGRGR